MFMYHNNYVRGLPYKDLRSKEMGVYYLDLDGEYSSTSAKYFTVYTLNITKKKIKGSSPKLREHLNQIVQISNALDRTFVVPPLFCGRGKYGFCNICYYEFKTCFKSVLDYLKKGFRESVILYSSFYCRFSFQIPKYQSSTRNRFKMMLFMM